MEISKLHWLSFNHHHHQVSVAYHHHYIHIHTRVRVCEMLIITYYCVWDNVSHLLIVPMICSTFSYVMQTHITRWITFVLYVFAENYAFKFVFVFVSMSGKVKKLECITYLVSGSRLSKMAPPKLKYMYSNMYTRKPDNFNGMFACMGKSVKLARKSTF